MAPLSAPARNAACPCGSGLRFKRCCGAHAGEDARERGLALHRQGRLVGALDQYDAVLRAHPDDWDVAHMRAVALLQLGLIPEARAAFAALLSTPAAALPGFWTNLGLLVAAVAADPLAARPADQLTMPSRIGTATPGAAPDTTPLPSLSVVMPTYNHAGYVRQAIASVFAQTHPALELLVIDDGSCDVTVAAGREALASAPIPVTFVARENRGAPTTLNQAIELARGEFIQPLNSDDFFPQVRNGMMLAALRASGSDRGFARVACVDASGNRLDPGRHPRALSLAGAQDSVVLSGSVGLGLLRANAAISSGNLTFRKSLWQAVGGFRDYRYNHDWDFCLRAALHSEPVVVPETLYAYRLHASNTIAENSEAPRAEQRRVMADFIAHAQGGSRWPNPLAPVLANWGDDYLALLGATDALRHLPPALVVQALFPSTISRKEVA
jgi:glycosyltransferase involved in cell wall biosynthesis